MDTNPNEQPKEAEVIDILTRRARVEELATPSQELSEPEHLAEVIELKPKPRSEEGVTQLRGGKVIPLREPDVDRAAEALNLSRMNELISELEDRVPADPEKRRQFINMLEEKWLNSPQPTPPIPDIYA